jgi:hypothetical protein
VEHSARSAATGSKRSCHLHSLPAHMRIRYLRAQGPGHGLPYRKVSQAMLLQETYAWCRFECSAINGPAREYAPGGRTFLDEFFKRCCSAIDFNVMRPVNQPIYPLWQVRGPGRMAADRRAEKGKYLRTYGDIVHESRSTITARHR